ncbi:hypothetical protein BX661DRAFT_177473, partial [Kickxella alabastrina]|uniref:uncharacterized protein n=1 Tax=Kickxella alabastrina TaxID=61397 RepID=UPI00221F10CA
MFWLFWYWCKIMTCLMSVNPTHVLANFIFSDIPRYLRYYYLRRLFLESSLTLGKIRKCVQKIGHNRPPCYYDFIFILRKKKKAKAN